MKKEIVKQPLVNPVMTTLKTITMKTIIKQCLFVICVLLLAGGITSCKKEKEEIKINYNFTVVKQKVKESIAAKETVEIGLKINRGSGYKGKFFLKYNQQSGNGMGTLEYNGKTLSQGVKQELSSDDVTLPYTASTDNYHLLDFNILNDQGKQVDVSVAFNDDRQGNNDNDFTVTSQNMISSVSANETVAIRFQLNKGKAYQGKYFIQYFQSPGNGLGTLNYNGLNLRMNESYEITNESIQLLYTATTHNYHQLDFSIFDEFGVRKDVTVIFNEDRQEEDDQLFSASLPLLPQKVSENDRVSFKIDFKRGKTYTGQYFIQYEQLQGYGQGTLYFNGISMSTGIPYLIMGEEILLNYYALSDLYHELAISIYDEQGQRVELNVIFNEDRKGEAMKGFDVKFETDMISVRNSALVTGQLEKIDKGYTGKYFINHTLSAKTMNKIYLQYNAKNELLSPDIEYELKLDDTGKFLLYYVDSNVLGSEKTHQVTLLFSDERGYTFEKTLTFRTR